MNKYDLSILIPARNEAFLYETVQDILKNKRGKTEIIIHLDGYWPDPGIPDHPDITIIYSPEAIGQRAGTNKAARVSRAKYLMKADAHLSYDEGFDVKLLAVMQPDWTLVPMMRNLHVFDWKCIGTNPRTGKYYLTHNAVDYRLFEEGCGHAIYQSPTPEKCPNCGGNMERLLVWRAKESPRSTSFCFDSEPHFQYFNDFKKRPEGQGELTETMSIQGSLFMVSREKYWELDICSEDFGSWGSQGIEVACKTWLSGGKVMCLQSTWYAHMFRTQGGDFSFPYPQSGRNVEKAKKHAKELFFHGTFKGQKKPLSWLLEKFWPVYGWKQEELDQVKVSEWKPAETVHKSLFKGIVFNTDNTVPIKIAKRVQNQLSSIGLPIVSTSLKPMGHFGKNIHIPGERGYMQMFKQFIASLEESTADIIYMCEHDVLYHPSHFDFTPPDPYKFYYNINWYKIWDDGKVLHWDANQVSGLVAYRKYLLAYYYDRLREVEKNGFNRSYEPGGRDATKYEQFKSAYPNLDIRTGKNLTRSHRSLNDFRDKSTSAGWMETTIDKIPGWENLKLTDFFK